MKITIKIVLIILFLATSGMVKAQVFEDGNGGISSLFSIGSESSQQIFLFNQNISTIVNVDPSQENNVFITQIGDDNEVHSETFSNGRNIYYVQIGDYNIVDLNVRSENINESIFQRGNNNVVFDINGFKNEIHSIDVRQNGDNQNLTLFGSNSISEKLKVFMEGQNQTIVIRSFD